ncbi:MAG: squalene synthase HpnC [Candidatus Latescibacteria bacterium]|nr:squalene synthase HpnC [Candidatus Latescibacterota bacterium]MBT4136933.1 squalene synthase HpnC [Candidatus Latescibacterota bacterium]
MRQETSSQAPNDSTPISLAGAYDYCAKLTQSHYENFPVGSILIPKHLRPHVHAIYAFARTADDYADEPGFTPQERLEQLQIWEDNLLTCQQSPVGPIFIALAQTISTQQIPIQLLQDLLTAFRMDVQNNRHESLEALHHYCTYSANPVGRLILHLFGYRTPLAGQQSDAICSALQLANFWQDIAIDYSRDRIYLPKQDMANFGVTEADLKQQNTTPQFKALLAHLIQHTEQLFHQGFPLLTHVKGRLRYELRLTWLGGMDILKKIPQNGYDIFQNRPTVHKSDLPRFVCRALWPFNWHKS